MIVTVALLLLGLTAALQIFFHNRFFRHLKRMHPDPESGSREPQIVPGFAKIPVTVLICARNEAANLERYLQTVLTQNYFFETGAAAFEVIVVNDASTDGSEEVLKKLQQTFPVLRVVPIDPGEPRTFPGKKFALSRGLAAASNEVVVCTDADCEPASDIWLHCMAAPFLDGKSIVAGYGGYRKHPGWLNWFIRYETMHTFFLYYAFWKGGAPYMAVGRNMAATRTIYDMASRHPAWTALPSGDDDLLIQLCATRENMVVLTFPPAFTWSEPKRTPAEYIAQKRRHVSTGKFYNARSKRLLSLYGMLRLLQLLLPGTLALFVYGIFHGVETGPLQTAGVTAFLFCAGCLVLVAGRVPGMAVYSPRLRERESALRWLAFSLCWLLYNAVLAPWILWKTKQRWK